MIEALHAHGDTYSADSGHVVLDYTNTLSWRTRDEKVEFLKDYTDLVIWGKMTGLLGEERAHFLLKEEQRHPEQAVSVYQRAIALREALYRILSDFSSGVQPGLSYIAVLNKELSLAMPYRRVEWNGEDFQWSWDEETGQLDSLLWYVVGAAADLFTSDTLQRVGECQGIGCGWLFIDTSKNHSRRWCDMESCGNRAKARRHYKRKQSA
jgi:predicted RNA-binding Zn ribbon-like protein